MKDSTATNEHLSGRHADVQDKRRLGKATTLLLTHKHRIYWNRSVNKISLKCFPETMSIHHTRHLHQYRVVKWVPITNVLSWMSCLDVCIRTPFCTGSSIGTKAQYWHWRWSCYMLWDHHVDSHLGLFAHRCWNWDSARRYQTVSSLQKLLRWRHHVLQCHSVSFSIHLSWAAVSNMTQDRTLSLHGIPAIIEICTMLVIVKVSKSSVSSCQFSRP